MIRAHRGDLSRPRRTSLFTAAALAPAGFPASALAEEMNASALASFFRVALDLQHSDVAVLALMVGVIFFAAITAVMLLRTRRRAEQADADARAEIMTLRAEADRSRALLLSEPQVIVIWPATGEEPDILGDTSIVTTAPVARRALAFGTWLAPDRARAMERAVEALRARGEGFAMALTTLAGRPIEAEGRAIGNRAVLRLKDVSGAMRELAELGARHDKLVRDVDTLQALIESLPSPVWARDATGRLVFVNPAYVRAVEGGRAPTCWSAGWNCPTARRARI